MKMVNCIERITQISEEIWHDMCGEESTYEIDHETNRTWYIKTPEILYDFIMREDQGIDRRGSLYYLFFKFENF